MDTTILNILGVESFQEAESILQQPQNSILLDKIVHGIMKYKGKDIDQENASLILDIIYNQNLSDKQQLQVLSINDFNLTDAFFQHHRDTLSLTPSLIKTILEDESLNWLCVDLVAYYPLSQDEITFLLQKLDPKTLNFDLIRNIITFQALNKQNIEFLRINFPFHNRSIQQLLIENQTLPDEVLTEIIKDQELLTRIIQCQRLSDHWIKHFLDNDLFFDKLHVLFTYQTMSEAIIDYIFSKNDDSLLFLLIRLQPLDINHKLLVLESNKDSIIKILLKNQRFTEKELKIISESIPAYNKDRLTEFSPNKQIDNNLNRRLKRDHDLNKKLALLQTAKI